MMRPMEPRDNTTGATAIVLAGGRSSRMGRPKALLLFDDQPLIVHIVNALRRQFSEVIVVASPGQDLPSLPATIVRDDVAYQGPVGGIAYGLAAAAGDVCFVTACDSAFLRPSLIAHLLSQIEGHDVVVPHWQGRFQPLHAVYRKSVLPFLQAQLARGELRPIFLFDHVRTRRIDEDEIRRFDPEGASFFNMNTPEDYAEALTRWSASIHCIVELFGVARLLADAREVPVTLPANATLSHLLAAVASELPALVGRVIRPDGSWLVDGYACNMNGVSFVRAPTATVQAGDHILILSADAGG